MNCKHRNAANTAMSCKYRKRQWKCWTRLRHACCHSLWLKELLKSGSCIVSSCLRCGFLTSATALLRTCTDRDRCTRESVLFVTPRVPQNPILVVLTLINGGSHILQWPTVGYTLGYFRSNNAFMIIMQAPQKSLKWLIEFHFFALQGPARCAWILHLSSILLISVCVAADILPAFHVHYNWGSASVHSPATLQTIDCNVSYGW